MVLIRTKKLNGWLGTMLTPEQVAAEAERYDEMLVAIDEMMRIGEIRQQKRRRDAAVKNWFTAQHAGHEARYMKYRQ